ncbi:MAG: hypothetical protein ACODAJ_10760 [Planctomycetota bacterium]
MAKKTVIVAGCLALIVLGVYMAWPKHGVPTPDPEDYQRPWVCEACGHRFQAVQSQGMGECPECGARKAVQLAVYVCKACGAEFDAYRFADFYSDTGDVGPDGKPALPAPYYRLPDGDWKTGQPAPEDIACPECGNSDPAQLEEKRFGP